MRESYVTSVTGDFFPPPPTLYPHLVRDWSDPQRSLQVLAPAAILGEGRWVVGSAVYPLVVEGELADPPGKLKSLGGTPVLPGVGNHRSFRGRSLNMELGGEIPGDVREVAG